MAQVHASSGDVIDLQPLGDAFAGSVTTAIIKSAQLELMRLVLLSGKGMREHHVQGEITVLCIEGLIAITTPTHTRQLAAGQFVLLAASEPHALQALADSTALLTICLAAPT